MNIANPEKTDKTLSLRLVVAIAAVMAAVLLASQFSLASNTVAQRYTLESNAQALEITVTCDVNSYLDSDDVLPAAEYKAWAKVAFQPVAHRGYNRRAVHLPSLHIRGPPSLA